MTKNLTRHSPWRCPRYPEYKDSGVEWLGEIPVHWDIRKLKHISSVTFSNVDKHDVEGEQSVLLCNYIDVYYNDYITATLDFMKATASPDEIKKFALRQTDVIITKDSESWDDIAVPAYVSSDIGGVLCGYHLALIRPDAAKVDGQYLFRSFSARGINDQFRVAATGITRYGLGKYWLDNAFFPVPPLPEQHAIAAFLDRETAKIDSLVAKKRRLVELLREKRAALISHVVTKGLNPDVPMKDSGVEWLGEIPADWEVKRLKFVAEVRTGAAKGRDFGSRDTVELPYLRVANVQDGFLDLSDIATITIGVDEVERYLLKPGDVLMNEGGDFDKLGRGYVWHGEIPNCVHQNHVFAVRPRPEINPYWLNTITLTSYAKFYFILKSKQTTNLASISSSNLKELPVLFPPKQEQGDIIDSIDRETAKIDALIAKTEETVAKLQEYRTALISAAVTGKIDVRGETSS
jgi:type I restriction enzyme S subunit